MRSPLRAAGAKMRTATVFLHDVWTMRLTA